jgi:hypothetical protein
MNNSVQLVLGMCIGAMILGSIVFAFALLREIRSLTKFTAALVPLLKDEEIRKSLASFRILATVGIDLSKKIESLNETTKVFVDFAISRPQQVPGVMAAAPPTAESSVHVYDEEEAASRSAAAENRARGIETDESRVIVPQEGNVF